MSDVEPHLRRAALAASAMLGAAVGLLSEWVSDTPATVWVPDLAVGLTFFGCGLIATERRPHNRYGLLMVATGLAWFLPNFASVQAGGLAWLAWLASHSVYLHRGPLIQLMVTFPTGRPTSRLALGIVVLGYLSALGRSWSEDLVVVPLALLVLALAIVDQQRSRGPSRRARSVGLRSLALVTFVLVGGAAVRLSFDGHTALTVTRWVVEVALCVMVVYLLVSLLGDRWERAEVTDLVVELGTAPSDRLRVDLARALGDPGLEIAYWVPDQAVWVDSGGRTLALPRADSGHAVTPVEGADGPLAALVHDPAVLDDQGLLNDVRAAAALSAANARLQAQVRERVAELTLSRRRLLDAADEERQRLEQRLHEGARSRLETLAQTVAEARSESRGPETVARLAAVDTELAETLTDLTLLGRSLHPRELSDLGFGGALRALAARSPFPVSVSFDDDAADQTPAVAAAAAYYICSEALANSIKHARATSARIAVSTSNGHLTLEVADDGAGGADSAGGSGLRGLVDRVETLGGSLTITSLPGAGTRLAARIPLAPRAG